MTDTHMLTNHSEIQKWVAQRKGLPAIARVPNSFGEVKARLALRFSKPRIPYDTPTMDDGMSPCSWNAWLAELDRQHLALKVNDHAKPSFEFVERKPVN